MLKDKDPSIQSIRGRLFALAFRHKTKRFCKSKDNLRIKKTDVRELILPVVLKGLSVGVVMNINPFSFILAALVVFWGALHINEVVVSSCRDMCNCALCLRDVYLLGPGV